MILVFVLKLRLLYTAEPAESGIARAAQRSEKNLSETTRGRRTQVGGHCFLLVQLYTGAEVSAQTQESSSP